MAVIKNNIDNQLFEKLQKQLQFVQITINKTVRNENTN